MKTKKQIMTSRILRKFKTKCRVERRKELLKNSSDKEKKEVKALIDGLKFEIIFHKDIEIYDLKLRETGDKEFTFSLLDGLTEEQKTIVTYLVEEHGFHPLMFDVYVKENRILYRKTDIYNLLRGSGFKTVNEIRATHPLSPSVCDTPYRYPNNIVGLKEWKNE